MRAWIIPNPQLLLTTLRDQVGRGAPEVNHPCKSGVFSGDTSITPARSWRSGSVGSAPGHHSVRSHTTEGGEKSSSESELSHDEEDAAGEDENTKADKGGDFKRWPGGIRW